jgi:AraC-like DNA-binding protein
MEKKVGRSRQVIPGLPASAAGRVGVCRNSAEAALAKGFSYKEIASALGLPYSSFLRAWKRHTVVVPEHLQLPLPPILPPIQQPNNQNGSAPAERRPLPVVGGDAILNSTLAEKRIKWR